MQFISPTEAVIRMAGTLRASRARQLSLRSSRPGVGATGRLARVLSLMAAGIALSVTGLQANPFYVSLAGSDTNPGTEASPFRTVERARTAARAASGTQTKDIVIYIRGGRYELANTLMFDGNDSGRNGFRVIYRSYPGESVSISGGQRLTGWTHHRDGIYRAPAQASDFRQLYVDGSRAVRARTPNSAFHRITAWNADKTIRIPSNLIHSWSNMSQVEMVTMKHWNQSRLRVGSFTKSGDFATVVPQEPERSVEWLVAWPNRESGQAFYFENSLDFLDQPGEWYLDRGQQVVYYMPRAGENIQAAEVIAPRLERLLDIRGASDLQFKGLAFEHSNWTAPSSEGFIGIQAGSYRVLTTGKLIPSAVYLESTQRVLFERNAFRNLGTSGLELAFGTLQTQVIGNAFGDIAGNGVSVYTLLSNRNPPDHLRCRNDVLRNNYITRVGQDYTGTVGIFASYPRGLVVENNEFSDMPYTAINMGWGWTNLDTGTRDNLIRYNRIHGVMNLMDDGAGIYTLSKQQNTIIEENHIHNLVRNSWAGYYEISGLYLDEQSEGITMRNNVVQNLSGVTVWKQNRANANSVYNNGDGIPNQQAIIERAGLQADFGTVRALVDKISAVQTGPFHGTAAALPGRIQAEDFDFGGPGTGYYDTSSSNQGLQYRLADHVDIENCSDAGGGHSVGWTAAGEWLQYTVSVKETGTYDFRFRVATPQADRTLHMSIDGQNVTGTITAPNTGAWQQWQTVTVPSVSLQAGERTLRVHLGTGGLNLNWIEAEPVVAAQPVTVTVTAPAAGAKVEAGSTVSVSAAISPSDDDVVRVEFFAGSVKIGERTVSPYSISWTPTTTGAVAMSARATDATGTQTASSPVSIEVTPKAVTRSPFNGQPATIPGRIVAVEYDQGGPGVAYADTTPANNGGAFRTADEVDIEPSAGQSFGHNIGWTVEGEWLEYTVDVSSAGRYQLAFAVASERSGSHFRLHMNGEDVSGQLNVPNTGGWQKWSTISGPEVELAAGRQVMRVAIGFGEFNLGSVEFTAVAAQSAVAFTQWSDVFFSPEERQNPQIGGPGADPDGDGIANLLEYAFNRDPRKSNREDLPAPGKIMVDGEAYLTLNYTRVAGASDVSFTVESSSDMVTWTSDSAATRTVSVTPEGPVERVTVRAAHPLSSGPRFLRLRVTQID